MSKIQEYYIRWNILLADIFFAATMYFYVEFNSVISYIPFIQWIAMMSVMLGINIFLASKEITLNKYIIFNAIAIFGLSLLGQSFVTHQKLTSRIIFIIIFALPLVHSALIAFKKLEKKNYVYYFDGIVILEIFFIGMEESPEYPMLSSMVLFGILAGISVLGALILTRLKGSGDISDKKTRIMGTVSIVVTLLLLAILGFMASSAVSDATKDIIDSVSAFISKVLMFFVSIIVGFLDWLASLLPNYSVADVGEPASVYAIGMEKPFHNPNLIKIVVTIVIIAVVCYIFYYLRGRRLRLKFDREKGLSKFNRENYALKGIRKVLSRIFIHVRYIYRYLKNRDSAEGLFIWTLSRERHRADRKKISETPSGYLRRIKSKFPEAEGMIEELSKVLESIYFSQDALSLPEGFASRYRSAIQAKAN